MTEQLSLDGASPLPSYLPEQTLADAREDLGGCLEVGVECPCCGQHAQEYRRSINAGMARALYDLYWHNGADRPVHVRDLDARSHEVGQLRWWGLIVCPAAHKLGDGYWIVTALGERWLRNQTHVRKYAHIYNGRRLKFSGPPWTVAEAIGDAFDLDGLLRRDAA